MIPFIVDLKVAKDVIGRKNFILEVNSHHVELRNELDPNSQREHLHLDLILYLIREHIDRVAIRRGKVSAVVKELGTGLIHLNLDIQREFLV
jgi:hypothetical protein